MGETVPVIEGHRTRSMKRLSSIFRRLEFAVPLLILGLAVTIWARQGASTNLLTQDRILVQDVDPITGIEFGAWDESVWIPGIDFLLLATAGSLGAGILLAIARRLRRRRANPDESG